MTPGAGRDGRLRLDELAQEMVLKAAVKYQRKKAPREAGLC